MERCDLERQYEEAGSISALARQLGVPQPTMRYRLKRAGIATKRTGYRSPKSSVPTGADSHNWAGGTYRTDRGYIYEYAPDHPAASTAKGYVLQHRLVMERALERLLEPDEIVHHVNGVKDDNRVENLELTRRSEHVAHHKAGAGRDERGRFA